MTDNDKLAKPVKLGQASLQKSALGGGFGLRSKLAQAKQQNTLLDNIAAATERIVIVADDSGSMDGYPMEQQKKAIEAFLGVCNPKDTAVGVTPMNREQISLTTIHPAILSKVKGWPLHDGGGTPTYATLKKVLEQNPTRVVLVSDGQPTDKYYNFDRNENEDTNQNWHPTIQKYKDKKVKIDTVFIGSESDETAIKEMKEIAELTGGLYIFFKEGESFAKQFKYLAPAYYAMLTSGQIKV